MSRQRLTAAGTSLIWVHYQAAGDSTPRALAATRGGRLSTFENIVRRQGTISGLSTHPKHHTTWTPEQKAHAAQIISMNPGLALGEVATEAVRQGLTGIGPSTLQRDPNVLLSTRKLMRTIPQARNAQQTKYDRRLYCELFSQTSVANLSSLTNSGSRSECNDGSGERQAARWHAASLR
jgi:hypothetical protein